MSEVDKKKITILYASQTGNCQDVSERLWREAKNYNFYGPVLALDDFNISELINEKLVVFVCSTTGQGEEPDNMKKFWKFLLRKNLPSNSLYNMRCAVLGLGDSSYVKYNFVAKRLYKRLMQLGAEMILPLALADDQHDLGYDAIVDEWVPSLWQKLIEIYSLENKIKFFDNQHFHIDPRWNINIVDMKMNNVNKDLSVYYREGYKNPENAFCVLVKENRRLTTENHFQDVRLIKFRTNGEHYEPGDVLYIRPKNSKEQIDELFDIFKSNNTAIDPETSIKIVENDPHMPVPLFLQKEITLRQLCEEYFDLNSIPRRNVFSVLAQLTNNDLEKEKCVEFNTAEGQEDLYNYVNRPRRNITEVLRDFPHAVENLSIDMLFEIFSPIKPRAFSIASSYEAHKNEVHILVAVVRYKTKLVKERLGLCSNWLARLNVGEKMSMWLKKGSFRFPLNPNTSIIMVGPGTGVAPFRNYICEREFANTSNAKTLILFFGCRNKNHDFLCEEDFVRLQNEGKLTLYCAFSRDQDYKIYVQHKIEENGCALWELLKKSNVYIYIAGNSKNMPQSVREAFINICKKYGTMDEDDSKNFIDGLEKDGKYQTETWS